MKVKAEYQKLQCSGQKEVHKNLKESVRGNLIQTVWIHYVSNAKQKTQDHNGDTEAVYFVFYIIGKAADGGFDLFFDKKGHDHNKDDPHNNIHPYVSVKEDDGDLNSADQKYC